jgi:hypothetical protein
MTDLGYHVLLLGKRMTEAPRSVPERLRIPMERLVRDDPDVAQLFADAGPAVDRLRAISADLPPPLLACPSPVGPGATMADVTLAVTVNYGHQASGCEVDLLYAPPGPFGGVNPAVSVAGGPPLRDLTGITFGHWAAAPDRATKDWILHSTTLEALTQPGAIAAAAVGTTIAVSSVCLLACGLFPPACAACGILAVGAGGAVIDQLTSLDATALEHADFVGFGHFIDMKPLAPGAMPPDIQPGKHMPTAGPAGQPDAVEELVIALFDIAGMHLNYGASGGPKDYQITAADGHTPSIPRTAADWEVPNLTQLVFTPVDNLGAAGYAVASGARGNPREARNMGWPLHALGDASVPMHGVGASGYGHRPYEDSVDLAFPELAGNDPSVAIALVLATARWYRFVRDRQAALATAEVPVRDLVTAVATTTGATAAANPQLFQSDLSVAYLIDEDAAIAAYGTTAFKALQRDTMFEGVGASAAFLLAWTRVQ